MSHTLLAAARREDAGTYRGCELMTAPPGPDLPGARWVGPQARAVRGERKHLQRTAQKASPWRSDDFQRRAAVYCRQLGPRTSLLDSDV